MSEELYSLAEVAAALRVTRRRVRSWADSGVLDVLQPRRHAERLVSVRELQRLERRGFAVDWTALEPADPADPANLVTDTREDLPSTHE